MLPDVQARHLVLALQSSLMVKLQLLHGSLGCDQPCLLRLQKAHQPSVFILMSTILPGQQHLGACIQTHGKTPKAAV